MDKIFIIAEAGVNHNGQLELAEKLIDAAAEAGADAVKFQTFKAENIVTRTALKAFYQSRTTGPEASQYEMLKKLELDKKTHTELNGYCKKKKILFLSSPFDLEGINLLDELGLRIFKVPSGEITNLPYLRKVGSLKKKIMLSTGMADLGEIEDALDILTGTGTAKKDITLLHCNTEYPTPMEDVNLQAMLTIRDAFKIRVGYSDHTAGIEVAIAAAALGASVIEKHFTLDRDMSGPDHKASLEPGELTKMITAIRNIEKAQGDGLKKPSLSESKNKHIVRKSITASRKIKKGELFTDKNITTKRPGFGISPMEWDSVIGSKATRCFEEDELIEL